MEDCKCLKEKIHLFVDGPIPGDHYPGQKIMKKLEMCVATVAWVLLEFFHLPLKIQHTFYMILNNARQRNLKVRHIHEILHNSLNSTVTVAGCNSYKLTT